MNDKAAVQLGIKRSAEMAAVFMIGDGLLGLLQPTRHVELWRSDVEAVKFSCAPSSTARYADEHMACYRSEQV
jgi:hypothetical protein